MNSTKHIYALLGRNRKINAQIQELKTENQRMREALERNKEQASKHYRASHICEASQACQGIYDRCVQILKGGE